MKRIKRTCTDCGRWLLTPTARREHRCTSCQFVQAHIDLSAAVIGVPTRALRERRAS